MRRATLAAIAASIVATLASATTFLAFATVLSFYAVAAAVTLASHAACSVLLLIAAFAVSQAVFKALTASLV